MTTPPAPRFVPLEYIEEALSISKSQAYALVRTGALRAIRVGGRGQWRIALTDFEDYIKRAYEQTAAFLATQSDDEPADEAGD